MMDTISLVLVDDNLTASEAMAARIKDQPGFRIVGISADMEDAIRKVRETEPRAVVVDSRLRNHDSLQLAIAVREQIPEARVVITGLRRHPGDVVAFVQAGVRGLITKSASFEEFLETIRVVAGGGHALPRSLTGSLFEEIARRTSSPKHRHLPAAELTNRERQVLALIGDGFTNKEIATRLHVAVDTVRSHVRSLLKKFGVRTRHQMSAFARANEEHHVHSPGHRAGHRK
jgi:DNA-binding NarL/FixJ family response regulator